MKKNANTTTLKPKKKNIFEKSVLFYVMFAVLLIYTISYIVPFAWGVMTSFKTDYDLMFNPFKFPQEWKFDNYLKIWHGVSVSVRTADGVYLVDAIGMTIYSVLYVASVYKKRQNEYLLNFAAA